MEKEMAKRKVERNKKPKLLPSAIVNFVKENGFPTFNLDKHTKLWKKYNARNPEKHYGVFVGKQWYWYQNWRDFVLDYLKNEKIQQS